MLPDGAVLPPRRPWWIGPAVFAGFGALLGVLMSLGIGTGPIGVVPLAAGASAFMANVWAFAGADLGE